MIHAMPGRRGRGPVHLPEAARRGGPGPATACRREGGPPGRPGRRREPRRAARSRGRAVAHGCFDAPGGTGVREVPRKEATFTCLLEQWSPRKQPSPATAYKGKFHFAAFATPGTARPSGASSSRPRACFSLASRRWWPVPARRFTVRDLRIAARQEDGLGRGRTGRGLLVRVPKVARYGGPSVRSSPGAGSCPRIPAGASDAGVRTPYASSVARSAFFRSCGSRWTLRRRMFFGVTSTSSESVM